MLDAASDYHAEGSAPAALCAGERLATRLSLVCARLVRARSISV